MKKFVLFIIMIILTVFFIYGCTNSKSELCNNNGVCEFDLTDNYDNYSENEHSSNCPKDCFCGDGICDNHESLEGNCEKDC